MLASRAGGAEHLHLDIRRIQLHVHFLHLRQHRHRGGAGVDAAAGLRLRHPLDTVDAALEFQPGPGALALDDGAALLHAAKLRLVHIHDVDFPALGLSVHGVHPKQGGREQRALFPADAAPELHDDVFLVIGVPGQQEEAQLLPEPLQLQLGGGKFLLGKLVEIRVPEQLLRLRFVLFRPQVGLVRLHQWLQFLALPVDLPQSGRVAVDGGVRKLGLQVLVPQGQFS